MKETLGKIYGHILEKARIRPRPKPDDSGSRYADLNDRAIAAAIDVMLLYILFFQLFLWIQRHIFSRIDHAALQQLKGMEHPTFSATWNVLWDAGYPQYWALNAGVQLIVLGFIIIGMQRKLGYTPGKWLLGIRVVDAATLDTPSLRQYIVRFMGYIPASLTFFLISFNKQRRGVHDRLAGTAVIHIRPRGWYWQQVKHGFRWVKSKLTN